MTSSLGVPADNSTVDQKQIIAFVEDGTVATGGERTKELLPTHSDADDMMTNAVKDFLERPISAADFVWKTTHARLDPLSWFDLPREWLANQMVREKISGFRYLKCDIRIRVQVNAQPFNAGRLIMYYVPLFEQISGRRGLSNTKHLGGITGFPHVELDLSSDTAMELVIPFNNMLSHFDLCKNYGTMGRVEITVYSPLTGGPDVDATVFIWADNIDIQLPTGVPLGPMVSNAQVKLTPEMSKKKNVLTSEKKRPGNVETASNFVGTVARAAMGIPLLSALATPVSYIADAVSGVASIFGWSKPQDPEYPVKMEPGYAKYVNTFNGDSKAKTFAFDVRNEVQIPSEVFNTDVDEMAIQHIVSQPTFLCRFGMSSSDGPGTHLMKIPVTPEWTLVSGGPLTTGHLSVSQSTFVSYVASLFAFWRGSLCYKLKVVKTPFHSGRIRLDIVPGYVDDTYTHEKCYSQIYDLRETTEIEVCVPYKFNNPWKSLVGRFLAGGAPNADADLNAPTWIVISVVNALRQPETCADNIDFLVEISGGEDLQFAFPKHSERNGYPLNGASLFPIVYDAPKLVSNAQGDVVVSSARNTLSPNSIGIGEVVTSLRQVLKRYDYVAPTLHQVAPYDDWIEEVSPYADTHENPDFIDGASGSEMPLMLDGTDYYSWIQRIFRFVSGSMRIAASAEKLHPENNTLGRKYNIRGAFGYYGDMANQPLSLQYTTFESFAEFHIPFYQRYAALPTRLGNPPDSTNEINVPAVGGYTDTPMNRGTSMFTSVSSATDRTYIIYRRSTGEDFSFGFLVGPPLVGFSRNT